MENEKANYVICGNCRKGGIIFGSVGECHECEDILLLKKWTDADLDKFHSNKLLKNKGE